jgi:hypothetical protein
MAIRPLQHDSGLKSKAAANGGWVSIDDAVEIVISTYGDKNPVPKYAKDRVFILKVIYEFCRTYRLEFRNKDIDANASEGGDVRIDNTYLERLGKSIYDQHAKPILRSVGHMFKFVQEYATKEKLPMETEDQFYEALSQATGINFHHFTTKEIAEWMQSRRNYEWDENKCAWALCLNFRYDCELEYFHFVPVCDDFPAVETDFSTMQPIAEQMQKYYIWKLGNPATGQSFRGFLQDLVEWKDCTQQGLEGEIKRRANAWETVGNTKGTDVDKPPSDPGDDQQSKKPKIYVQDPAKWEDRSKDRPWDHQKPYSQGDGKQWGAPMPKPADNAQWGQWKPQSNWAPSSSSATDNFKGKGKPQAEPRIGGF